MPSILKRGTKWQARTHIKGVRKSATFATKAEAAAWALNIESDPSISTSTARSTTFKRLLQEYADKVSNTKRGERWEITRINMICRQPIAEIRLANLSGSDFAKWRDDRLKEVSSATVRREWNLLSSACNIAVKEWQWLPDNPMRDVKRPANGKDRTRRVGADEVEKLMHVFGWDAKSKPKTTPALIGLIFCFAIETAMRAGEILSLTWENVDLKKQTAHLPETKNGHSRTVPLSTEAVRLLKLVGGEEGRVFPISSATLDAIFRKYRDKAALKDLHFHDTRREALSRISKKLDPFQLAKMSGHRDMRMLLNVYYQEDASVTAKLLG